MCLDMAIIQSRAFYAGSLLAAFPQATSRAGTASVTDRLESSRLPKVTMRRREATCPSSHHT